MTSIFVDSLSSFFPIYGQESLDGLFHSIQTQGNFCYRLKQAVVVSDEKAHQSLLCVGGDQCCSDCDGTRNEWALDAYNGMPISLEEVFFVISSALSSVFSS